MVPPPPYILLDARVVSRTMVSKQNRRVLNFFGFNDPAALKNLSFRLQQLPDVSMKKKTSILSSSGPKQWVSISLGRKRELDISWLLLDFLVHCSDWSYVFFMALISQRLMTDSHFLFTLDFSFAAETQDPSSVPASSPYMKCLSTNLFIDSFSSSVDSPDILFMTSFQSASERVAWSSRHPELRFITMLGLPSPNVSLYMLK